MERVNDVCRRIMYIKALFVRVKTFKYPRKKEFCIQIEYRVPQTWGIKSQNGSWKCKSFWFHY